MTQEEYQAQLEEKKRNTLEEFRSFGIEKIEVFPSAATHYRMRAEFRVWHEGDDLFYIMFNQQSKEKYRVDSLPAASEKINALMPVLLEKLKHNRLLRHRLFQIDFLSSLSGEMLVSLLYHKALDEEWEKEVQQLRSDLAENGVVLDIIGRAKKMKKVIQRDYVVEQLTVHDRTYIYKQVENSFTQPNGKIAEKMLEWAVTHTRNSKGDLLELYCGNGNFSIALAQNFNRVLATELAKPSVESAQWNIAENKVENLKIARLSAEELTQAMQGVRPFQRLKQQAINIQDYDFSTVLVDPPRAGMDEKSVRMVQQFSRILYISCNPKTLLENLALLQETHEVTELALFDQFPFTEHRELGVVLQEKLS